MTITGGRCQPTLGEVIDTELSDRLEQVVAARGGSCGENDERTIGERPQVGFDLGGRTARDGGRRLDAEPTEEHRQLHEELLLSAVEELV